MQKKFFVEHIYFIVCLGFLQDSVTNSGVFVLLTQQPKICNIDSSWPDTHFTVMSCHRCTSLPQLAASLFSWNNYSALVPFNCRERLPAAENNIDGIFIKQRCAIIRKNITRYEFEFRLFTRIYERCGTATSLSERAIGTISLAVDWSRDRVGILVTWKYHDTNTQSGNPSKRLLFWTNKLARNDKKVYSIALQERSHKQID